MTGWLIEQIDHSCGHRWLYLTLFTSNGVPFAKINWTSNANYALRFARKEDAYAFAALHPTECILCILTEHIYI